MVVQFTLDVECFNVGQCRDGMQVICRYVPMRGEQNRYFWVYI
jgi:hypothetical protein